MITENLSTLKIHRLSQAQYDRELAAGTLEDNALYLTPETPYSPMTGATSYSAGSAGLVPAPPAGANTSFLRGDGTWATLIGNPNLLMNGDFQVWQRGERFDLTSDTLNTSFYTADRWYATHTYCAEMGSYIEKTSSGMYLNLNDETLVLRQVTEVPFSYGNAYTLQVSVNNTIYTTTFEEYYLEMGGGVRTFASGGNWNIWVELVEASYADESSTIGLQFRISAYDTFTINWIKLERGLSATPFTPKSYEEELAACKRYYQEIESPGAFLYNSSPEVELMVGFDTMTHAPNVTITKATIYTSSTVKVDASGISSAESITKNYFTAGLNFGTNNTSKACAAIVTAKLDTEFDI